MEWNHNLKLGIILSIILTIIYIISFILYNYNNVTGKLAVVTWAFSSPLMLLALFLALIGSIQEYYKIKKRL